MKLSCLTVLLIASGYACKNANTGNTATVKAAGDTASTDDDSSIGQLSGWYSGVAKNEFPINDHNPNKNAISCYVETVEEQYGNDTMIGMHFFVQFPNASSSVGHGSTHKLPEEVVYLEMPKKDLQANIAGNQKNFSLTEKYDVENSYTMHVKADITLTASNMLQSFHVKYGQAKVLPFALWKNRVDCELYTKGMDHWSYIPRRGQAHADYLRSLKPVDRSDNQLGGIAQSETGSGSKLGEPWYSATDANSAAPTTSGVSKDDDSKDAQDGFDSAPATN